MSTSMDSLAEELGWLHQPTKFSVSPPFSPFYSQTESATEEFEYDLESMDIHIRETYFATSAERGRWLSSPIASRARSQAILPMRGHSSPIKTLVDSSPLRERSRRHPMSRSIEDRIITSSSEERDEDVRCSSPLPPSSPLSSPMSDLSFLSDPVVDPHSNSNDCQSLIGTPELSISSTSSPVEPTRRSTLAYTPCHSPSPINSRHASLCSPRPIDISQSATSFELDDLLSPLSQFDLDLPEVESPKLPLSDTANKPYPGQHGAGPRIVVDVTQSQAGPSIQSLPMDNCEPFDTPQDTGGRPNKKAKKCRHSTPDNPGVRRTRKRIVPHPSSDAKRKREPEGHSVPPNKKFKSSSRREGREKSLAKRVKRIPPSPSRSALESCDSVTSKSGPTTQPATDSVNDEFHASLTGMVIEALATSRATSMDASALYLVLIRAHPHLAAERSKGEFLMELAEVLEVGRTRCGMFAKVDCSGEGSRHKAFESRWFYVPERDEDQERASLISAIMPRQKRNETKKYKQYYYRPLGKISRWDPEDAP